MRPHSRIDVFNWFKGAARNRSIARELYGVVVAQSRRPELYLEHGIPDTAEGRFEAVAMHLTLLLERLNREGETGRNLGQMLTETFVTDMDDNLREMGVGDLAVPRRVKKAAAGLYERALRYRSALATGASAGALRETVRDLVLGPDAPVEKADALAAHMRAAAAALNTVPAADLLAGRVRFEARG